MNSVRKLFLVPMNFGIIHFETLNQFNFLSFEICEFSSFNQILLCLFDVLYVFQHCI